MPKLSQKNLSDDHKEFFINEFRQWLNKVDKQEIALKFGTTLATVYQYLNFYRHNDDVFNFAVDMVNRKKEEHQKDILLIQTSHA